MRFDVDDATLHDLVAFARIEEESHDLEPWAEVIGALADDGALSHEDVLWLIKCYSAYDSLGSAWAVFRRWPSPEAWAMAGDGHEAADYPCTQERRGLRGGRVLRHLDSYAALLDGGTQDRWLRAGFSGVEPERDFGRLTAHLRRVWGCGRQTAFEWAEFLAKAAGYPVTAADAQLWESEGPRRALQRLYGNEHPTVEWLDEAARRCRDHLIHEGVTLAWEDFETVICDFNVMRDGRYYPGRHLAALREEIEELPEPEDRALLDAAFLRVVPPAWHGIEPGIDPAKMTVYRDTGRIVLGHEEMAR